LESEGHARHEEEQRSRHAAGELREGVDAARVRVRAGEELKTWHWIMITSASPRIQSRKRSRFTNSMFMVTKSKRARKRQGCGAAVRRVAARRRGGGGSRAARQ